MANTLKGTKIDGMKAWVRAGGGLRLRDRPSADGNIVTLIPNFSEVTMIEETGNVITISGSTGKWTRMNYGDRTGWAFGGFLSFDKPGKNEIWAELIEKLKKYPREWTQLSSRGGRIVIYKECFGQIRGVFINPNGSGGSGLIRSTAHDSIQYLILDVTDTGSGAIFTVRKKHSSDSREFKAELRPGRITGWIWRDTNELEEYVEGNYSQKEAHPDFPIVKEKEGGCGQP